MILTWTAARRAASAAREPDTPAAHDDVTRQGRARRALVADDDPATRYLLTRVLQRHQIAYDEAENGVDAVKYLKKNEGARCWVLSSFASSVVPRLTRQARSSR